MKKILLKKKVLYISYDGLLESLGKSQILEYLYANSKKYKFYIISFEKIKNIKNNKEVSELKDQISKYEIKWIILQYHNKRLLHKICYNFIKALMIILYLHLVKKIKIFHIRSYIPGLIIFPLLILFKIQLIFDIRGFLPQEKIDRLKWKKNSIKIITLKIIEKFLFKKSKIIVTLTKQSKQIISKNYKINEKKIITIPTCVNITKFNIHKSSFNENIKLCFLGSLNLAYDFENIVKFYSGFIKEYPKVTLDFILNDKNNYLKNLLIKNKINENKINIKSIDFDKVSDVINKYDFGLCVLKQNESIKASFPTKIAEYLSCGLPLICNNFNNDITSIISKNNLGIIIYNNNYDSLLYKKIMHYHDLNTKRICRKYAESFLSIDYGSFEYLKIYDSIS